MAPKIGLEHLEGAAMHARHIMTAPVVTTTPFTRVQALAALLLDRRIGGVPVLECGRLVGMVSETDLLRRQEIGTDRRARACAT
jgi:CBS domain-containing protein